MAYTRQYIETHDIDWFCIINGQYIHGASNCGDIPPFITMQSNREVMAEVSRAPFIVGEDGLEYNEPEIERQLAFVSDYHLEITKEAARERYLMTFKLMAKRGFCSFDRVTGLQEGEANKGRYVWLVRPRENWNLWKPFNLRAPSFVIEREKRDIDVFDVRELYL